MHALILTNPRKHALYTTLSNTQTKVFKGNMLNIQLTTYPDKSDVNQVKVGVVVISFFHGMANHPKQKYVERRYEQISEKLSLT